MKTKPTLIEIAIIYCLCTILDSVCMYVSGDGAGSTAIAPRVHQRAIPACQLPCCVSVPLFHSDL